MSCMAYFSTFQTCSSSDWSYYQLLHFKIMNYEIIPGVERPLGLNRTLQLFFPTFLPLHASTRICYHFWKPSMQVDTQKCLLKQWLSDFVIQGHDLLMLMGTGYRAFLTIVMLRIEGKMPSQVLLNFLLLSLRCISHKCVSTINQFLCIWYMLGGHEPPQQSPWSTESILSLTQAFGLW